MKTKLGIFFILLTLTCPSFAGSKKKQMKQRIATIEKTWLGLNSKEGFDNLSNLYAEDVDYIDPYLANRELFPKEVKSLELLNNYWWGLYSTYIKRGVLAQFRISKSSDLSAVTRSKDGNTLYVHWEMFAVHAASGADIAKLGSGLAELKFNKNNKVIYHKDHMDVSNFLFKEGKTLIEKQQELADILLP